jgi:hypothetical protein
MATSIGSVRAGPDPVAAAAQAPIRVRTRIVANGWGSQFIVIFPRLDMAVVTTGGNDDNGRHDDVGMVLSGYLVSPMQTGGGAP